MRHILIVILLWFLIALAQAQEPGARGTAFGESFAAVADDYSATHWNPAGLSFRKDLMLGAMAQELPFDREFGFLSGSFVIGRLDRLGVSWSGYTIGGLEARRGNSAAPDYWFSYQRHRVWLSYARRLSKQFGLGINGKLLYDRLDEEVGFGGSVDLGLMWRMDGRFRLGLACRDLMSRLRWTTRTSERLDRRVSLAGSYRDGPWLAALGLEVGSGREVRLSGGTEFRALDALLMRMGFQGERLAMGLGFDLSFGGTSVQINYGVVTSRITTDLSQVCGVSLTRSDAR